MSYNPNRPSAVTHSPPPVHAAITTPETHVPDNQPPQQPEGWPQQPGPPMPPGPGNAPWGAPPPPQKKSGAGKAFGLGCLGVLALFVVIGIISAIAGGGDSTDTAADKKPAAKSTPKTDEAGCKKLIHKEFDKVFQGAADEVATVYDTGACKGISATRYKELVELVSKDVEAEGIDDILNGAEDAPTDETTADETDEGATKVVFKVWGTAPSGVDTTYGSDSENLQGPSGEMTKTLTIKDDALYYAINAQLQGGGDIHCSVTIGDKTKEGHAAGGYNICSVQLNSGLFGGWD